VRKNRRKIIIRVLEVAGVGFILLDAVLYLALYRPLEENVVEQQQKYSQVREHIRDEQVRLDRLEKFQAALPGSGQRWTEFTEAQIPPRRSGYSAAAHVIHQAATDAGVQYPGIVFRRESVRNDPLIRLGADITTVGPYPTILKFIHALESADTLVLLRSFNITLGDNNTLNLRLGVDFYITP